MQSYKLVMEMMRTEKNANSSAKLNESCESNTSYANSTETLSGNDYYFDSNCAKSNILVHVF